MYNIHIVLGRTKHKYPACVGLVWIGSSRWPWKQKRYEVWTDMVDRPYPLHLRLVPNKYITWNRNGAKLRLWPRKKQSQ